LALFTIFFGFQPDLFIGIGVGYMNIYGLTQRFSLSSPKAKVWENKFPFKKYNQNSGKSLQYSFVSDFVIADGNQGLPTFIRTAPPM
jgi:hypothetical protein